MFKGDDDSVQLMAGEEISEESLNSNRQKGSSPDYKILLATDERTLNQEYGHGSQVQLREKIKKMSVISKSSGSSVAIVRPLTLDIHASALKEQHFLS